MRHRTRIFAFATTGWAAVALAAAAVLPIVAAHAKEVRFPAQQPRVTFDVPEDWTVAEAPLGLELQSPEKNSLVLVTVTAADRRSIDSWAKLALERMTREGVTFAKTSPVKPAAPPPAEPPPVAPPPAEPPPAASQSTASQAATPEPTSPTPGPSNEARQAAPALASAPAPAPAETSATAVTRASGDRPYSFGGPPTIGPPKILSENTPSPIGGRAGDLDLQTLSDQAADPVTMKPSGHFLYTGGVLQGQPVDVELSVFPLGKSKRLLTEQLSGATDARAVMIVRSLRDLKR